MEEKATTSAWEGGGAVAPYDLYYANASSKCCELGHSSSYLKNVFVRIYFATMAHSGIYRAVDFDIELASALQEIWVKKTGAFAPLRRESNHAIRSGGDGTNRIYLE